MRFRPRAIALAGIVGLALLAAGGCLPRPERPPHAPPTPNAPFA